MKSDIKSRYSQMAQVVNCTSLSGDRRIVNV
jgi:hypothetical protein